MQSILYWLQSLFGMNLSSPIWGSLIPDATTNNNQTDNVAGSNDSLSLSNNQTDAIVGAISSSGSYLWSFKMYWVITAPVTLGTILLPLIAGHIFRYITRLCYENRGKALTISGILTLGLSIVFSAFFPGTVYLLTFGILFGGNALIAAVYTAWNGRYQWLSAGFSMVFAASFAMQWYVGTIFPITSVFPLVYLVLFYFRVVIKDYLGSWLETYRLYMTKLLQPLRRHSWIWQASIVCIYYASAVSLPYWLPVPSLLVIGTPLGLLGLNRMVYIFSNFRPKDKHYWMIYIFVYLCSLLFSLLAGQLISTLCLALVPMTYLFAGWLYRDHQRWLEDQVWRLIGHSPSDRNDSAA